ncbi:DUF2065 domain-containing protein [Aliihoeflea sp. PC F10.4]
MSEFLTALGLVLVIEGFLYGGMPAFAKRMASQIIELPESTLRFAGLIAMVAGVGLVWFVKG